jgi:NADH dehydrogenase (ubiquinone) 1 beta subcomplex subunit 8
MLTVVSTYYPDRPSAPRTFPDGLEAELGGPRALRARKEGDE